VIFTISGAFLTRHRRDGNIAADQGLINNQVEVLINVEADLRNLASTKS
jgi:hypothetical protein